MAKSGNGRPAFPPLRGLNAGYRSELIAMPNDASSLQVPILRGLACRCPRCGKGRLFNGFLTLAARCESCGLDYSFADAGDGPAVFVILIAGFIVVGTSLFVEVLYQPPFWVHLLILVPLVLITTLGPLRPMKGLLIALQYHHQAAEGRVAGGDRA